MEIEQVLREAGLQFAAVVLQAVFNIVIGPLLAVVAAYVVIWLRKQLEVLKTRLTAEQFQLAETIVVTLVQTAEQLGITKRIADGGESKRQWVVDKARAEFERLNIPFDVDQVNSLLEAAVRQGVQRGMIEIITDSVELPLEPVPVEDGAS